jgi:hypothetical protein
MTEVVMGELIQWRSGGRRYHLRILALWVLLHGLVVAEEPAAVIPAATKEVMVLAVTFDNWLRGEYLQDKSGYLALVDQSRVKQMQETAAAMKRQIATGGSRLLYPVLNHADKEQMADEVVENFKQMTCTEVKKDKQFLVKVPSGASVAIVRAKDHLVVSGYQPAP